jgi:hypothetical protein
MSSLSTDAIALLLGMVQATVVLGLVFVLPGLALGPLVAPGAASPAGRLGRAIGVSLLTVAPLCTILARLGLLQPAIAVLALVLISVVPWLLRDEHGQRRVASIRLPTRRGRRWWAGAMAGGLVAAALVVVPSRLDVGASLLPFTSTVWYYAHLAVSTASLGRFPDVLAEWGTERPFQTDYLPVTAHTAGALQLLPGDLLVAMELYRMAILVAAVVIATMLFRRWFSSWIALLGSCLLLATVRLAFKFDAYKPETFAFVLALFGLWLVDRAIVERSRRLAIVAALAGGLVFLCHAEVFLVWAAAVVGIATARWLVAPDRRRLGLRLPTRRPTAWAPVLAVAVLVAATIVGIVGNVALTGEARLLGYATGATARTDQAAVLPASIVPETWVESGDPTWDFYVAAVAWGQLGSRQPTSFTDRRLLQRAVVDVWPGLDGRARSLLLVLIGLVGLPLVAWPWLDPRRRRAVATWYVFGGVLLAGSFLLFILAHTYVPLRVGPRRLVPYEVVLPVVAATVGLWLVDRLLRPAWRTLLPRRGAMLASGALLALLALAATLPAPSPPTVDDEVEPGLTAVGYDAYTWIAANTLPEARLLANAYTDGSLAALSGRTGLVDGRAVYLENRRFLAESTNLLLGARVAFAHPASAEAAEFLSRERVDYLIVAGAGADGSDLGGYRPFDTDLGELASGGRYSLVRTFGDGRLLLYHVVASP